MSELEGMSLEERLQRLQRLENRDTDDSLEKLILETHNDEHNDISNIEERLYRLDRTTPFRFSDYPKLRRRIIDRDTRLYDLPPVIEDMYNTHDDEGAVRDMASSVLAKRYKKNRRNLNIRTLKARDRLDLARIMEADLLPEDIIRKISRQRNKIDVHEGGAKSNSPNSKAKSMRHSRLMRLDPEYRKTHMATRLQSMYRGKSTRNKLSKRKSSKRIMEQELELEPELNLLSLAPDIQDTIGKNLRNLKLQKLSKENYELIENYKNKVRGNLPLTNYSNLLNTQIGNTHIVLSYNEFSNITISQVFKLPKDIANLLIGTIQHFELNNLQELLQFLANANNLNDFIFIFTLTLKQSFEYTPIEIQQYINNFLKAINYRFL
ncbi:hypothetical protein N8569_00775 [bacterium]|nr:hypothetical protein [bacterium]